MCMYVIKRTNSIDVAHPLSASERGGQGDKFEIRVRCACVGNVVSLI